MILIFILGLVALRILYSVGEICYERDWPRSTWKGLLIALGVLCIAVSAFGQAVRVDIPLQTSGPNVPISGGPLPQALWVANAAAYLCTHPSATLVACQAAPITTYTDSTEGTTCPTATPLVQLPGNTCTASTGTAANVGFWYGGGLFDYWIVSSYGTYGPFSGNSSNAGSGSGTVNSGTAGQIAYYPSNGTAVSGTGSLPNGITATTQPTSDTTSAKVETRAGVVAMMAAGSNGTISAVPGTGTITAAYAELVASGNLGGSIFLPCGTYLDNFQPSEPVTISGAAQNCVGVEPLNKALPALGIQILAPITGYSVAAGGVATITAVNAFVAGQGPIILDSLATSPGSTCLNGDYTSIISATPTQFTIPSSCTAHAFQSDTGNAATENWNFEIDNVGIDCPGGSGCQDAIQLQGRVDKDWITDQRKIHAVTIGPGFTNGIHIIGRCISCTFDEIAVTAPTGVGFLADHAVPGCSGTTATCNTATGQGGLNQSEIDDSTFQSSGNYGVGLGDNTSTLTLGFIMNNVVSQGNGQTAANGSCASIFAENIDNLSIKNGYVEDDCTSGNNGAGSAEIRVTGLYSDGFRVENEQFDISESIPPIYTDSTFLSGYAGTNICVGGTSSVLKSNQEHGLSGGLFEWGQNDCGPPVSILNGNGVSGVASEPLNLGFRQMSSGTTVDATSQSLIQLYNGITLKNITGGSIGRRITLTNTYAASTIYNAAGGVGQIFTFSGANESLPGGFRDLICSSIDGTGCDWTEVGPISKDLANCGTMTTTAAATNALSCSWVTTSSNCTATQNSTTTIVPWTAVVPTAGTVTVTHTATAGGVYAIACSVN